jgi:UDP-glucose 4-epimerase
MRVMVTGATTPFGAAIVDHLLAAPDVELVLAVGREREADPGQGKLVYHAADLGHARAVHDLLHGVAKHHAIDAVVHAAHHRSARDGGPAVHAQNVHAARSLVVGCADHPTIRQLVYRSFAEVYAPPRGTTSLIDEEAPLDFDPAAPAWVRDRVEADLTVCVRRSGPLQVTVLRCAELLAQDCGSQLWDYLSSRVCLRPAGYDPMLNVLALDDAVAAVAAALRSPAVGVFNIPGADTLPLSRAITECARIDLPVPGPALAPLYALRRVLTGSEFRYELNARRFHLGGILDGSRAHRELGYTPRTPIVWQQPYA